MSDEKVIELPIRGKRWKFVQALRLPRWKCDRHGSHDQVMHITTIAGGTRTYCVPCLLAKLEELGLKNIAADEGNDVDVNQ